MKKLFLFVVVALLGVAELCAKAPQLPFDGMCISGSRDELVKQIEAKNWKFFDKYDNHTLFIGDFDGEMFSIVLSSTPKSGMVYGLSAMFSTNNWKTALKKYNSFKKKCTKKYGKPIKVTEEYNPPYNAKSDDMYKGVVSGDVVFMSTFDTGTDIMFVKIYAQRTGIYQVTLTYDNSENIELLRKEL